MYREVTMAEVQILSMMKEVSRPLVDIVKHNGGFWIPQDAQLPSIDELKKEME